MPEDNERVRWTHDGAKRGNEKVAHIAIADLKDRGVYRIVSRNLAIGVYNAASLGFVGIREKFGSLYLFEEYHWDYGRGPYGTACPLELLPDVVPADVPIEDILPGSVEKVTGRACEFDKTPDKNGHGFDTDIKADNIEDKRVKGWVFVDTREYIGDEGRPCYIENKRLFDFLKEMEHRLGLYSSRRTRT